ncbi:hypothetical protein PIB30_104767, partial [Stylosanthes scabra]|nr:hypothetical protein [Stylosanthes scabra]
ARSFLTNLSISLASRCPHAKTWLIPGHYPLHFLHHQPQHGVYADHCLSILFHRAHQHTTHMRGPSS